jgi:GT2 family glycosyltransferase/2-polyprenyl-3-methyl-5-hydroxy-6-metoxy-1,4-benzoquinol methylase
MPSTNQANGPLVSIIVLNWNGERVLQKCIDAILADKPRCDYELIVVDNGSDQPIDHLVANYPSVHWIREARNHGFAIGNNIGAKAARGRYLVILNNDTMPTPGWLDELVDVHISNQFGITSCHLIDEQHGSNHCGYFYVPSLGGYSDVYREYPVAIIPKVRAMECDVVVGAAFMVERELFDSVGGFDEVYWNGGEDLELCLQVRKRGHRIGVAMQCLVVHLGHESMRRLPKRKKKSSGQQNERIFGERWNTELYRYRVDERPQATEKFSYYSFPREEVARLVPDDVQTVLDVGCGAGALGAQIKQKRAGRKVAGVEMNPVAAGVARTRLDEVYEGDFLQNRELGQQRFDCVVFADVLEHMTDPWAAMDRARHLLNPGGYVVASLPNIRNYKIIKKLLYGTWRYERGGILDVSHLRFFTRTMVAGLCRDSGFEILSIEKTGNEKWWKAFLALFFPESGDFFATQFVVLARLKE